MKKEILIFGIVGILVLSGMGVTTVAKKKAKTDNNPPSIPEISGPSGGRVGVRYMFELIAEDPDGDNVSYYIEWGDGTSDGWTDYLSSGEPIVLEHIWYTVDFFIIRCKAKDVYGAEGNWSEVDIPITKNRVSSFNIGITNQKALDNHPPSAPRITGPGGFMRMRPGTYEWEFRAIDPDDDNISYQIDWGDGDYECTDWYASGEEITRSHNYSASGTYVMIARAKDIHNATGDGTAYLIRIRISKQLINLPFLQFLEWFLERFPNALMV